MSLIRNFIDFVDRRFYLFLFLLHTFACFAIGDSSKILFFSLERSTNPPHREERGDTSSDTSAADAAAYAAYAAADATAYAATNATYAAVYAASDAADAVFLFGVAGEKHATSHVKPARSSRCPYG